MCMPCAPAPTAGLAAFAPSPPCGSPIAPALAPTPALPSGAAHPSAQAVLELLAQGQLSVAQASQILSACLTPADLQQLQLALQLGAGAQ